MEGSLGDGPIPAASLRYIMGATKRVRIGIRRRDRVADVLENIVIEDAIAHVDDVGGIPTIFDPTQAPRAADLMKRHAHVIDNPFSRDVEAAVISRKKLDVEMGLEKRQGIVVVGAKNLHDLTLGRVKHFSVGHDSVHVDQEGFHSDRSSAPREFLRRLEHFGGRLGSGRYWVNTRCSVDAGTSKGACSEYKAMP
jgi:hypothetical protein